MSALSAAAGSCAGASGSSVDTSGVSCPVCYDLMLAGRGHEALMLPCLHVVCAACARLLLQPGGSLRCPLCRFVHEELEPGVLPVDVRVAAALSALPPRERAECEAACGGAASATPLEEARRLVRDAVAALPPGSALAAQLAAGSGEPPDIAALVRACGEPCAPAPAADPAITREALRVLHDVLAGAPRCVPLVVEAGAVPAAAGALLRHEVDGPLAASALDLLASLACDAAARHELRQAGTVTVATRLLLGGLATRAGAVASGCHFLVFVGDDAGFGDEVVRVDSVRVPLVALALHARVDVAVARFALAALARMAGRGLRGARAAEAVALVGMVMRAHMRVPVVQRNGCDALLELCGVEGGAPPLRDMFLADHVLTALRLHTGDAGVQGNACATLVAMSRHGVVQGWDLSHEVVPVVLDAMWAHRGDAILQCNACFVLAHFPIGDGVVPVSLLRRYATAIMFSMKMNNRDPQVRRGSARVLAYCVCIRLWRV
jgi:hypothetical protein